MMSKERRIINTYDQHVVAGGDRICIVYQPRGCDRMCESPGWHVVRFVNGKEVPTDEKAAWYDRGKKFFGALYDLGKTHHERKASSRADAVMWAERTYGRKLDLVRNGLGELVEREVQELAPLTAKMVRERRKV